MHRTANSVDERLTVAREAIRRATEGVHGIVSATAPATPDRNAESAVGNLPSPGSDSARRHDGSRASLLSRLAASPWAPVMRKSASIAFALALLASIGAGFVHLDGAFGLSLARGRVAANAVRAEAAAARNDARARGSSTQAPTSSQTGASVAQLVGPGSAAPEQARAPANDAAGPVDTGAWTPDGKLVLNLATEADLRKLPGVGQKRAAAIIALREKQGRFRMLQDLRRVKGLGRKALAKIAPLVVIDPPASSPPKT